MTPAPAEGPLRTAVAVLAVVVAVTASAAELDRVYAGGLVVGIALVIAVIAAGMAAMLRVAASATAPYLIVSSLAVGGAVACSIAGVEVGYAGAPSALWDGLVDGPRLTLSLSLPVEPLVRHIAFVVALVTLAVAVALSLVLATPYGRAAVLPLLVLHGVAVLFGVGAGGNTTGTTAVVAAAAAVLLAAGHRGSLRRREPVAAVAAVIGCVVVGATAATALPGVDVSTPYDLRERLDGPRGTTVALHPLSTVRLWLSASDAPVVFAVNAPRPVDIRIGVLDTYNGRDWSVSSVAEPFTRELAQPAIGRTPEATPFDVVIRTVRPPLPLLPVPGGARAVAAAVPLRWDADSGLLVSDAAVGTLTYTVTTMPPAQIDAKARLAPPRGVDLSRYTRQPTLPDPLQRLVPRTGSAAERARAVANLLRDGAKYRVANRPPLRPGYSLDTLVTLLATPYSDGGRVGAPDQFGAAFATLARAAGVPARVVVGFRNAGGGSRDVVVRTNEVDVWGEVLLDRVGWVPFVPTPPSGRGRLAEGDERPTPVTPTATPSTPGGVVVPTTPTAVTDPDDTGGNAWRAPPWWAFLALVVVGYVTAVLIVPVLRRRRRRTTGRPRLRIEHAWRYAVGALPACGVAVVPSMTPREVVAAAAQPIREDAARRALGVVLRHLESARYAARPVTADDAVEAWLNAEAVVRYVAGTRHPVHRLVNRLVPRWGAS